MSRCIGRQLPICFLVSLLLAGANPVSADNVLPPQNFEDNQSSWLPFGDHAKSGITREPANVKEGQAALQFDYEVRRGTFNALILPVQLGTLAPLKSIRFWVMTKSPGRVAVVLQEQGGGRYLAVFTSPGEAWQRVELAPSDFVLVQDTDSPRDPNNRIDLELVEGIGVGDFNQVAAQAENNPVVDMLMPVRRGAHTLFIDDFTADTQPLKETEVKAGDVLLDAPTRPQVMWTLLGDATLTRTSAEAGEALEVKYQQTNGKILGVTRRLSPAILHDTTHLSLKVNSNNSATLVVRLEEVNGGKYQAIAEALVGEEKEILVPFSSFTAADDSRDNNGRLDIDEVHQLAILDGSGLMQLAKGTETTLTLRDIRATKAQ